MADWVTISALATAAGTLVLAVATFSSVRSANRAARIAERALMVGMRPLLVSSRLSDPDQKVHFQDGKWVLLAGGAAAAEVENGAVYFAVSLRNISSGIAVLHGWRLILAPPAEVAVELDEDNYTRLTRDLYLPPGDVGYWQGTIRDPESPEFAAASHAIAERSRLTFDIVYGDYEGGQRVVTRVTLVPRGEDDWLSVTGRHWNLDSSQPR